jgi:hypothetical protein
VAAQPKTEGKAIIMKKLNLAMAAAALGLCVSNSAGAQTLEPTPTVMGSLGETSALRLGITLAPMPTGTFKSSALGVETSSSSAFAFAIAPTLDYSINQFVFVSLAPQYILNVKGKDDKGSAGSELDLRLRVGGNAKVADTLMLYGYLAPGYGFLMQPDDAKVAGVDNPKGFVFGFAAGAMLDFTPSVFGNAELGYQVGFQKTTYMNTDVDLKTNFLHIGIGLGFRI